MESSHSPRFTLVLLCCLEVIAFVAACYGYLAEASGTAYTGGALLVVVSSLLILGATIVTGFILSIGKGLRITLNILLFLGFAGTIAAAWLLMNWVLLWSMIAGFVVWLVFLFVLPSRHSARESMAH